MKVRRIKAGAYNPARRSFVRLVARIRRRTECVLAAHAAGQDCGLRWCVACRLQRRADAHVARLKASGFYDLPWIAPDVVRPARILFDVAAVRAEVEAHAQAAQDARLRVGPTEYHDHGEGAGYPWPPEWERKQ